MKEIENFINVEKRDPISILHWCVVIIGSIYIWASFGFKGGIVFFLLGAMVRIFVYIYFAEIRYDEINFNKVKSSLVEIDINNKGKKICLSWSIKGNAIADNELLPGVSLLGYRLSDRLPHDPVEAKKLGKLIVNTRKPAGEMIDVEMRPGQTGYYALFLQIENPSDNENAFIFSTIATAIERAPEGEMAKLARKIRYQELEERLKNKSDQGGSIAEMARQEMEYAVARIENFGDFFKNIKETKEKSREKIKQSNMGDEDKEELLEAIDALADEVIDKKIGMGRAT